MVSLWERWEVEAVEDGKENSGRFHRLGLRSYEKEGSEGDYQTIG